MVRRGLDVDVTRWVDRYVGRLAELPEQSRPIGESVWADSVSHVWTAVAAIQAMYAPARVTSRARWSRTETTPGPRRCTARPAEGAADPYSSQVPLTPTHLKESP